MMGGHPYWYYIKYRGEIETTLKALRKQEFAAGRYNPVMSLIEFPITENSPAPGSQHDSIEEAIDEAEEEGTRSILDIFQVSSIPYSEAVSASNYGGAELFCTTFPLSSDELIRLFNTDQPTHELVDTVLFSTNQSEVVRGFWESIDRGTSRHILIYENNKPVEVFFVGYSFD